MGLNSALLVNTSRLVYLEPSMMIDHVGSYPSADVTKLMTINVAGVIVSQIS